MRDKGKRVAWVERASGCGTNQTSVDRKWKEGGLSRKY